MEPQCQGTRSTPMPSRNNFSVRSNVIFFFKAQRRKQTISFRIKGTDIKEAPHYCAERQRGQVPLMFPQKSRSGFVAKHLPCFPLKWPRHHVCARCRLLGGCGSGPALPPTVHSFRNCSHRGLPNTPRHYLLRQGCFFKLIFLPAWSCGKI